MKKVIIVLASLVTMVLAAAVLIPVIFKDEIQQQIHTALDDNLEAHVYFDPAGFDLSMFKNFPNPTATISRFGIVGKGVFDQDTLISVDKFLISIDLFSLFGEKYTIKSMTFSQPSVNVLILENGVANYDIAKAEPEAADSVAEPAADFHLSIDHWQITDGTLIYRDNTTHTYLKLTGINHAGSGNLSSDIYDLITDTRVDRVALTYDGINYLNGQQLDAKATVHIDLKNSRYTFKNNLFKINDFPLTFNGFISMPSDDIEMDISFASDGANIKSLYSLIPGVYSQDFDKVKAEGILNFNGTVQGIYNDHSLPAFEVNLAAKQGSISYPDLPTPISNININMQVACADGDIDHTSINIKNMHLDIGNNPLDGTLLIRNLKDYSMKADVRASLNLADLNAVFPIDSTELKGLFSMKVKADGIYDSVRQQMPAVQASISLKNGFIKSADFPKAIEDISGVLKVNCPTGKMKDMMIDIPSFEVSMEGQQLRGNLQLHDLVDYQWKTSIKGGINLEILSAVYPIEGLSYQGQLTADITSAGRYSDLEAGRYDKLPASGTASLTDFKMQSKDLPQGLSISRSEAALNPQKITINMLDGKSGASDWKVNGFIENYLDYIFKETGLLKGKMNLQSGVLDVNEWMTGEETPDNVEADTLNLETPVIPKNIDFEFNSDIKTIYYDNLKLQNAKGLLTIRGGVLDMSNFSFNMLGGSVVMNGQYDTRFPGKPAFNYTMNIKSVSIPSAYNSFATVQTFAPIARMMNGDFSTNLSLSGLMKKDLTPDFGSLNGKGVIRIADAFVKESKLVSGLAGFVKSDIKSSKLSLKDVIMKTSLENGRAYISPVNVNLGGQQALISGSIGADGTLDYKVSTEVEAGMVGQQVNQLLATLQGDQQGNDNTKIKLNFNVGGTYDNPSINLAGTSKDAQSAVKEQAKEEVENAKEEINNQVQDEAEKAVEEVTKDLQPELDSLKKNIVNDVGKDAEEILGDDIDSTANELKKTFQNLFKKKNKN